MSFVVVGLLVGLWAWVLLPGLLRERRGATPVDSVTTFERKMDTLGRAGGDAATGAAVEQGGRRILVLGDPERVVSARARSRAELRRRGVLARGGFLLAVAVVAGIALGGWWWLPAGVLGVPYAVYAGLAVRLEHRLAQQRDRLLDLDEERARRQPEPAPPVDDDAIELVVGDESGIIVTGWRREPAEES